MSIPRYTGFFSKLLVVHELVHLVERRHNDFFTQMMDQHLPLWCQHRHELNSAPLAHANWSY
jgi:predicted metal-dependent hydrolase